MSAMAESSRGKLVILSSLFVCVKLHQRCIDAFRQCPGTSASVCISEVLPFIFFYIQCIELYIYIYIYVYVFLSLVCGGCGKKKRRKQKTSEKLCEDFGGGDMEEHSDSEKGGEGRIQEGPTFPSCPLLSSR